MRILAPIPAALLAVAVALAAAPAAQQPAPLHVTVMTHFDAPWAVTSADLGALRLLSALHPKMRWTHLYNPAAYARTTPILPQIESFLKESRDVFGAEIGIHAHMYPELAAAAGVAFRSSPSVGGAPPCGTDPTGYTVPFTAYTTAERRRVLDYGIAMLRGRGLCHPRTFCAGYYAADPALQTLLGELGFTTSAAAFPPGTTFGTSYPPCWGVLSGWTSQVTHLTRPYRVSRATILPGGSAPWVENEFGPLVEIPQTAKIDWMVSAADMKAIFAQHLAVARNGTPTTVCFALHEVNANAEFVKYNDVLTFVDSHLAGPVPIEYGTAGQVRDAFLGGPRQPSDGYYLLSGDGCAGSGAPSQVCFQNNASCTLASGSGDQNSYALQCTAPGGGATVHGASLFARTETGTARVTVTLQLADANGAPSGTVLRSGEAYFDERAELRMAPWPGVAIAGGARYFICFGDDRIRLPVCGSGGVKLMHYWHAPNQTAWQKAPAPLAWALQVHCRGTGTGALPALTAVDTPRLGNTLTVRLDGAAPSARAVLLLGNSTRQWVGVRLPFDLQPLGAPGCLWQSSGEFSLAAATDADGRAAIDLSIPNSAALRCGDFGNQWIVLDGQANALGLSVSNRGYAVIGK